MITATDAAKEKIKDLLLEENDPNKKLRVYVQGGGCAGFTYGFIMDSDLDNEDFLCDLGPEAQVVIDAMSAQYLEGAEIDYKDELFNKQFVINNPNAVNTCGCGTSFGV